MMDTGTKSWLLSQMETRAGAAKLFGWIRMRQACEISQAISLKRIADSLEKIAHTPSATLEFKLPEWLHHEVTNMAWEAGRNFKH